MSLKGNQRIVPTCPPEPIWEHAQRRTRLNAYPAREIHGLSLPSPEPIGEHAQRRTRLNACPEGIQRNPPSQLDLQKFETQIVSEKNFVRRANRATGLSADFEDKEAEKMAFEVINKSGSYEEWVTKSYLLLGDIYFKEKDYFNAKATFQSISENAKMEDLRQLAKQKLSQVEEEEKKSSKISADN